ncbi:PP2C family protein-serine/threonine phosphatase [Actinomadura sp. GTD37]|uniref:PP2C family protein-serine/threonine phosphatase n=1 Tax=Actinomadura sp. GTD37 TaxID=1778030 RepID=UPI0035C191CE
MDTDQPTNTGQRSHAPACRTCGDPAHVHDRFCENCGTPDPAPAHQAIPAQAERPVRSAPSAQGARQAAPSGPDAAWRTGCADCGGPAVGADGFCERCGLRQPDARDPSARQPAVPDSGVPEPGGREHVETDLGAAGAAVSDVGLRRRRNEDAFAIAALPRGACAVVCDGVATAPGSAEASLRAADAAVAVLTGRVSVGMDPRAATRAAVERAAEVVAGLAAEPDASPACTFVSAIADPAGLTVGWVGDSRAYWLGETGSCLLTRDDSWAESMIEQGAMTAADARADRRAHAITAWLGADAGPVEPHVAAFRPTGPGVVVLCSDGLWNDLPEAADLAAAATGPDGPMGAARRLLRAALDAGGRDNVTVAVLPCAPPGGERGR